MRRWIEQKNKKIRELWKVKLKNLVYNEAPSDSNLIKVLFRFSHHCTESDCCEMVLSQFQVDQLEFDFHPFRTFGNLIIKWKLNVTFSTASIILVCDSMLFTQVGITFV